MNVIVDAANLQWLDAIGLCDPSEIGPNSRLDRIGQPGFSMFGPKDDMTMQRRVGVTHKTSATRLSGQFRKVKRRSATLAPVAKPGVETPGYLGRRSATRSSRQT